MDVAPLLPSSPLTAAVVPRDAGSLVHVTGELDVDSGPRLVLALVGAVLRYGPLVGVDLGDVVFVDSAGLSAVREAQRLVAARGGRLEVTEPGAALLRLLALLGAAAPGRA